MSNAKVELAGNKVLRNDLAAPRSGVVATWSSERPYFLPYRSKAKQWSLDTHIRL